MIRHKTAAHQPGHPTLKKSLQVFAAEIPFTSALLVWRTTLIMIHLFTHSHILHTAFVQPAHSQSLPACDHKLEKALHVHIGTAFATASFHHVMIFALAEVLFAPTFCLLRGCPAFDLRARLCPIWADARSFGP